MFKRNLRLISLLTVLTYALFSTSLISISWAYLSDKLTSPKVINITTNDDKFSITGVTLENVNPSCLEPSLLEQADYLLLEYELLQKDMVMDTIKDYALKDKYIYLYGPSLTQTEVFSMLGIENFKVDTDNTYGQTQIIGFKILNPKDNIFFTDIYWTENKANNDYLLACISELITNDLIKTLKPIPFVTITEVEAADQYIKKGTNRFTYDYNPYGKVSRVADVYKQTNDGSDTKDWWYIRHFSQPQSGKYFWNNLWRTKEIYIKDQPGATGKITNLNSYGPTPSPTSGTITVSLPTGISWSFNVSGFLFGYNKGGIAENYVEWIAKPGTLPPYLLPDSLVVEPGSKFETPQNGIFYNRGYHTVVFNDTYTNVTRTNYLSIEYNP